MVYSIPCLIIIEIKHGIEYINLASAKEHAIILENLLEKFRGLDILRIIDETSGTGLL